MKKLSAYLFTFTIMALVPALQAEELTVIHHGTSAVSALRYYDSLSIESGEKAVQPLPDLNFNPELLREEFIDSLFPIKSQLSPGSVRARTISAPGLVQPIFLVGYDQSSIAWLSQRSAVLQDIGATGLVVNVPNRRAMTELQQAAGNLTLTPVVADDIAQNLGITNYPVLVTQTSIEQ